jgi:hypothetical protein
MLVARMTSAEARIAVLEAKAGPPKPPPEAAASSSPKARPRAPRPTDREMAAREELWAQWRYLSVGFGNGQIREVSFCRSRSRVYPLDPREFGRWLHAGPDAKKYVAEGSVPDQRFRAELTVAIRKLQEVGRKRLESEPPISPLPMPSQTRGHERFSQSN